MPEFDEALVERLLDAFGRGAAEDFAQYFPGIAAAGGQALYLTPSRVKSGIRAVLSALSQDYVIIPRNSGEERDAASDLAMCEAATPGPWGWKHSHCQGTPDDDEMSGLGLEVVGPPLAELGDSGYSKAADARFMASSRTMTPYWIKQAAALRAALSDLLDLFYDRHPRGWELKETSDAELRKRMEVIGPDTFRVGPVLAARALLPKRPEEVRP